MAKKPKEIQQGAYGFLINFITEANMATTESLLFRVRKKGATEVTEHVVNVSNIVDRDTGEVNVLVEEGDFDVLGSTKFQLVDNTTGRYIPSQVIEVKVVSNV